MLKSGWANFARLGRGRIEREDGCPAPMAAAGIAIPSSAVRPWVERMLQGRALIGCGDLPVPRVSAASEISSEGEGVLAAGWAGLARADVCRNVPASPALVRPLSLSPPPPVSQPMGALHSTRFRRGANPVLSLTTRLPSPPMARRSRQNPLPTTLLHGLPPAS